MAMKKHLIFAAVTGIIAAVGPFSTGGQAAVPPSGASSPNVVPPEISKLVADGQKAIRDGNVPLAIIQFKNASSALPRNGSIRAQLGVVLMQSGDYYSAERELRQARKDGAPDQMVLPALFQTMLLRHEESALLEEFSNLAADRNPAVAADIFKAQALALQNLGQTAEAAAAMEKSLKLRRDLSGLLTRARIAQQQGDLPAAISFADEAAKLAPQDANTMLFKFGLLIEQKDLTDALALSDQIIAKFPDSLPARFSRVEIFLRMNQTEKAKAEVDAIIAKHPTNAAAAYYRAVVMARSGDVKGAWRNAQALPQQLTQSAPSVALVVAQMAVQAGAPDTGAAILSAAIGKFPKDSPLRLRLAAIRLRQNNTAGAVSALEPIRDSLDPATAGLLARLYVKSGKSSDALALLEKLEQSGKGTDATTLGIVGLEAQQGQPGEALNRLIQASARKPTDPVLARQLVAAFASSGRFSEALATADRLGSDPQQRPLAAALRGEVLLAQGNLDGALASYSHAIELDPKNAVSLYGRASVLEFMRKYAEANRDLHAVLAIAPDDVAAYLKLAEIAANQGHDQEVRSVLSQAIQKTPQTPAVRIALVRYLLLRRDGKAALTAASALARMQPDNADATMLLGQAQFLAGQKREAIASFRRLAELSPKASGPQVLLGNALIAGGDQTGGMDALKKAVTLDSKSVGVRTALINILVVQGKFDDAIAAARAFQTISPGSEADLLLGDTLYKAGRRDQAAFVYQQSFTAKPNGAALMRVVQSKIAGGNPEAALDTLADWVTKNPKDTAVRMEYATMLMARGDKAKASTQYEMVLKADANNVMALNNLGWLKQTDDPKRALVLVSNAVKLAPDMPEVLDTLAWLKLQQKQATESLPLLQRAHSLRPGDGQITYHLVLALNANGKRDEARATLKSLLASKSKFEDRQAAQALDASWH